MSAHTPGPWIICEHEHANVIWADNGVICDVFHANEDDDMTACVESPKESEANARLIAAAPDLLGVLNAIDEWLGEPIDHQQLPDQIEWARGTIQAAVAKATQP